MKAAFHPHALERMEERGATPAEVIADLQGEGWLVIKVGVRFF